MLFSENKSKRKIRISIIDVLIIITVIACIAGVFIHYKVYEKDNRVLNDDRCSVSIKIGGVLVELSDKIAVGDKIYLESDNSEFGVVSEVSKSESVIYYRNANDEIVEVIDSSKSDITVVVDVKGSVTQNGFRAGGNKHVAAGMNIDMYTHNFSGKGLIFDVKQLND